MQPKPERHGHKPPRRRLPGRGTACLLHRGHPGQAERHARAPQDSATMQTTTKIEMKAGSHEALFAVRVERTTKPYFMRKGRLAATSAIRERKP